MRRFDIVLYVLVLCIVLAVYIRTTNTGSAPEPLPDHEVQDGPMLPLPSIYDEQILISVDAPRNGIGTAFAINREGDWLTARHVVEGCREVYLLVAPGRYIPIAPDAVITSQGSDLALLRTGRSPEASPMGLDLPLRVGTPGYHVGYPGGGPGEVATRLLARSRLVTRGLREGEEPVLAWAEVGRTQNLTGPLAGLSGAPVFDRDGRVRGVVVAESPRRGRIYTAAPSSITDFLAEAGIEPEGGTPSPITLNDYGARADAARNSLQVVKVACEVS